jgi:hypothetical protein
VDGKQVELGMSSSGAKPSSSQMIRSWRSSVSMTLVTLLSARAPVEGLDRGCRDSLS